MQVYNSKIENLYPLYKFLEEHILKFSKQDIDKFHKAYNTILNDKTYLYEDIKLALETAIIVAKEINLCSTSIISALLHQYPEKHINYNNIQDIYDHKVINIITGIKKIKEINNFKNLKKIFLCFVGDIRIILIRIAEKLASMRKVNFENLQQKYKIIIETKYIYLPLINRLGLDKIYRELEDLCLKYLNPNIYYTIAKKLKLKKNEREILLNKFIEKLKIKLESHKITFKIKKRTKSIGSIWNKIKKRGIPFKEVYDLSAIRIILVDDNNNIKDKDNCWRTFNIMKNIYKIKDNRVRDWISKPKTNGYEALHLTVIDDNNNWAEIQIRSKRMDELAERGTAAHWKYKNDNISKVNIPGIHEWLDQIKVYIDNYNLNKLYQNQSKLSLYTNSILVLNKNQSIIELPFHATLLDYAFKNNEKKALFSLEGKINHQNVPLKQKLHNGDTIEIIYSNKLELKSDWLEMVNSERSKKIINSYIGV